MSAAEGLGPVAARLEALLFAAAEPLSLGRLAAGAGVGEAQARRALAGLAAHLDAHGHGMALVELAGGYQLLTRAEHAEAVAGLSGPRQPGLSRAALETLAIIAFRQPVTRAAIEELRGVHSEGALSTLQERGLVAEAGRADAPGRPILYVTARRFLEHFGLRSLQELHEAEVLPLPPGTADARPRLRALPGAEPEAGQAPFSPPPGTADRAP